MDRKLTKKLAQPAYRRKIESYNALIRAGDLLSELMKKQHIGTREMAGRVGTTEKTIIEIINGSLNVSLFMYVKALAVLGYSLEFEAQPFGEII